MALRRPGPDARRLPARTALPSSLPRVHSPPSFAAAAAAGSLSPPEARSGRRSAGPGRKVRGVESPGAVPSPPVAPCTLVSLGLSPPLPGSETPASSPPRP